MDERRVSITALVTAFARAYHATHDDPKIFDDYLANELYSAEERAFFAKNSAASLAFYAPELAAQQPDQASAIATVMRLQSAPVTLSRSAYTENALAQAIVDGVKQYVILGAGLDTYAFRHPEVLDRVMVFEVDHPVMQADKRRRLAEHNLPVPPQLHFVPVNFATQDLDTELTASAYDPHKETFFSWLGVTYYLTRAEVMDTLKSITQIAPSGSSIIFDYFDSDALDPAKSTALMKKVIEITTHIGEPVKTGFDPNTLAADLAPLGLQLVETLGPPEIQARYFSQRTDGYHAFEHAHFAWAKVI